ncbi:MAG: hypothetical protein EZS28_055615, partial [Streblomastix strix]
MERLRLEDPSQRFEIPERGEITDRSAAPDDLHRALEGLDSGREGAMLEVQHCILGEIMMVNPKQAQKTVKKLAKKFIEQNRPELL